jgi:hypothetical protein
MPYAGGETISPCAGVLIGLERRFLSHDELVFDAARRWRWPFLAALEDALVESPGSGRLYQSSSQRSWPRHRVTGVRQESGVVTAICGDSWGPVACPEAARAIEVAEATYYLGSLDDPVEVLPELDGDHVVLRARDEAGEDQLIRLGPCPERAG